MSLILSRTAKGENSYFEMFTFRWTCYSRIIVYCDLSLILDRITRATGPGENRRHSPSDSLQLILRDSRRRPQTRTPRSSSGSYSGSPPVGFAQGTSKQTPFYAEKQQLPLFTPSLSLSPATVFFLHPGSRFSGTFHTSWTVAKRELCFVAQLFPYQNRPEQHLHYCRGSPFKEKSILKSVTYSEEGGEYFPVVQ